MATHLAVYTSYSLLSSSLMVDDLVQHAVQRGYTSLAITDSDGLYGAKAFQKACQKYNIQPIYGITIQAKVDAVLDTFIVLAKSVVGYQELIEITSRVNQDEVLDLEQLSKLTHECIVIMLTEKGLAEVDLLNDNYHGIIARIQRYQTYFREMYASISMMGSPLFYEKNMRFLEVAQSQGVPILALPKVNYLNKGDQDMIHVLQAIAKNTTIQDTTLVFQPYRDLIDLETFERLYPQSCVALTDRIASQCQVNLDKLQAHFPSFYKLNGIDASTYLNKLCQLGLAKRFNHQTIPKVYEQRLNHELKIIKDLNFENYFLVVYDFILYAHRQNIIVGPGRGSAAASLVAYCLGITQIDPIEYDLIFERFLNPQRVSMPDIDSDFPDNRRDEIIEYLASTYGKEHVAHIVTFSTLSARQVLRDVAKAYSLNSILLERLLKSFNQSQQTTLEAALENSRSLPILLSEDKQVEQVYRMALRLEGLPRQKSIHAAGVVLSAQPLRSVVPTVKMGHTLDTIQYSMEYLEAMGLVKIDILGLRNLTIITRIVEQITKVRPDFNLATIPLNDRKTYQLLQQGDTQGIFQLESEGMTQLLKRVHPSTFMDISDTIALYRPGPMQFRETYLENRKQPHQMVSIHPALKEITKSTYGILIYQEQIMQTAMQLADFDRIEADILRKAMSKKDSDEMKQLQEKFINAMVNKGYSLEHSKSVFSVVERFAAYGFNKAHSVAYSLIAYQMAYLKANYPLWFYQSLLSSVIFSSSKLKTYLDEIMRQKIKVLPPSINDSTHIFEVEKDALRMPLNLIKGIGDAKTKALLDNRQQHGPYKDFVDFITQALLMKLNSTQLENMIYAGALDEFKLNRMSMVASLKDVLDFADLIKVETASQTVLDFTLLTPPKLTIIKENKALLSLKEKEVLGFYFSYHPLKDARDQMAQTYPLIRQRKSQQNVTLLVYLVSVRKVRTKKGDMMAFVTVEDEFDSLDAVVFPRVFVQNEDILNPFQVVLITGKTQEKGDFIINHIQKVVST